MLKTIVAADLSKIDVDTGKFDQVAGWALGTSIVLVAISMIIWAMVIPMMRRQGKSTMADGINKLAMGVVAAALLSGCVSFATWNSTSGTTTALMPAEARTGSLTVEKEPALVTCPEPMTEKFSSYRDGDRDASYALISDLVGKAESEKFKEPTVEDDTTTHKAAAWITWQPTGPDCTTNNRTPQSGTEVAILYRTSTSNFENHRTDPLDMHELKISVK